MKILLEEAMSEKKIQVTLGNYKGVEVKKAEIIITEEEVKAELSEWENQKEPQPERSEAVIRNRQRLDALGIPYQEFYKVIEFGNNLKEEECNHLEEALLKMGILDALVIDEQYKEQVLHLKQGCEDRYLFSCKNVQKELQPGKSLLDVLELNEEVNDIFSNQRLTGILGSGLVLNRNRMQKLHMSYCFSSF